MFTIRKISSSLTPEDRKRFKEIEKMPLGPDTGAGEMRTDELLKRLRNPIGYGYRTLLFIIEDGRKRVKGFAVVDHFSDRQFCFLERLVIARKAGTAGLRGALYQRVRENAKDLECSGLFTETGIDAKRKEEPEKLQNDIEDLFFFESFGSRPISDTDYEEGVGTVGGTPRFLLYDNLGLDGELSRRKARSAVRVILERLYAGRAGPELVDRIVESIQDDPVRLRKPRYTRKTLPPDYRRAVPEKSQILVIANDRHAMLNVKRRGNVEVPVRIFSILKEIMLTNYFTIIEPDTFSEKPVRAVHSREFVDFLDEAEASLEAGTWLYPFVFPARNRHRLPKDIVNRAGYYCIDLFTPLNPGAILCARDAVNCALTGAKEIRNGPRRIAYALVRPPGHHAESSSFGGYCYLNSASIAANHLSRSGTVAMLDLDYHHGNGHQEIFYWRSDVLTVSIHRDPEYEFPYYTGYRDERGDGDGEGFNYNFPLEEHVDGERYRQVLREALRIIADFEPAFLVVPLGLDPAKRDPLGTWELTASDFQENGRLIGSLRLPTLVVQEGGYETRFIGKNACRFFIGLWESMYS